MAQQPQFQALKSRSNVRIKDHHEGVNINDAFSLGSFNLPFVFEGVFVFQESSVFRLRPSLSRHSEVCTMQVLLFYYRRNQSITSIKSMNNKCLSVDYILIQYCRWSMSNR